MSDWAIGLSTGCFYDRSIFDCLEVIRDGGFCMLEVCTSAGHLDYRDRASVERAARKIGALGMEAYSLHAPFAEDVDPTALDWHERKRAIDNIMAAAEAAAVLQVRYFVIHPGPEKAADPPPEERLRRMHNAADTLNRVAERCKELEVGFVLENMLPHLLFGNLRDMMWLLGAIRTIEIGACLDTGHAYLSGDMGNVVYKLAGHLAMVHANDNTGESDAHLTPGDGNIDWKELVWGLSRLDFGGGLVLELAAGEPAEVMERARRGRLHLRRLAQQVNLSMPTMTFGPVNSEQLP